MIDPRQIFIALLKTKNNKKKRFSANNASLCCSRWWYILRRSLFYLLRGWGFLLLFRGGDARLWFLFLCFLAFCGGGNLGVYFLLFGLAGSGWGCGLGIAWWGAWGCGSNWSSYIWGGCCGIFLRYRRHQLILPFPLLLRLQLSAIMLRELPCPKTSPISNPPYYPGVEVGNPPS